MFQSIINNIRNNIKDEDLNLKNYHDFDSFDKNNLESFEHPDDAEIINKFLDKFECLFNNLDIFLNFRKEFKNNSIYWNILYFMFTHKSNNFPNISGLNICEYIFFKKRQIFDKYLLDCLLSYMCYDDKLYSIFYSYHNACVKKKYHKNILNIIELKYKNYKLEKEIKKLKDENLKLETLNKIDIFETEFNKLY